MSESIGSIYLNYLKEQFIKDVIKTGKIPTTEEINVYLKAITQELDNLNSPLLTSKIYKIEEGEESSAKKMNKTFSTLHSDLSALTSSVLIQGNKITDIYDATTTKLSGISEKIGRIKSKSEDLLFGSKNSNRHEEIFYERFESFDMVDKELTTADVDISSNSVTLKFSENNVVTIPNASDNIEVVPESNSSIITSNDVQGLEIINILSPSGKRWAYQVKTKDAASQLYVDVIIRNPSNKNEVNRLIVDPAMINIKTQVNAEIAYSQDKLNWIYPDGEYRKRLIKKTAFDFSSVKAQYWRIRLIKYGNDGFFSNSYAYNYGLQSITFIGKSFEKVNRNDNSIFYSKVIKPQKALSAVNTRVCETKPYGTSIKYSIAPLTSMQCDNISNGTVSVDDLHYYLLDLADKESHTLDLARLAAQSTTEDLLISDQISYKDMGTNDRCLNLDVAAGINKTDAILLRGIGDNSGVFNEDNSGWLFNGIYYSTNVLVENPEGELIDLGETNMLVNGVKVSGKIVLKTGLNHIISPKEHWQPISNLTKPESASVQLDPLYPYNHKFLIEGIGSRLYGNDLSAVIDNSTFLNVLDPDQKYRTKRRLWKIKMREESFGVFESKEKTALDIFTYKLDNNNSERIVVKSVSETGSTDTESFSIISRIQDSTPIVGLIFKAELLTNDVRSTPVLTEYLLKFR